MLIILIESWIKWNSNANWIESIEIEIEIGIEIEIEIEIELKNYGIDSAIPR